MVLNVLFLISVAAKYSHTYRDGVLTIQEGNCNSVDSATTVAHIWINALSSILLAASNYTQQTVSSPTRAEISRAHAKGDWLDIGVTSVRNIFGRIHWTRTVVWCVLQLATLD